MTLRLLIAEDDHDLAEVVAYGARQTWPGCRITIAATGQEALASFTAEPPDLVVLDVSMPAPDGFEVCQRIRQTSQVPILMLTVRRNMLDKVRALDLGADDYLTKPFDHLELFARLRALVRRASPAPAPDRADFTAGELALDFALHEVRLSGDVLALSPTEYLLLAELARHAGRVLPHQFLLERVWGSDHIHDVRYLKEFVSRLRRKLDDDAAQPRYIQTIWGIGYRFLLPT
ncbi:MAG TPA: response regulator transcription factor [Thermomicrobiales bacterium]|nr:response regulator transcription factor [Thermomicrobiales bacterium]